MCQTSPIRFPEKLNHPKKANPLYVSSTHIRCRQLISSPIKTNKFTRTVFKKNKKVITIKYSLKQRVKRKKINKKKSKRKKTIDSQKNTLEISFFDLDQTRDPPKRHFHLQSEKRSKMGRTSLFFLNSSIFILHMVLKALSIRSILGKHLNPNLWCLKFLR